MKNLIVALVVFTTFSSLAQKIDDGKKHKIVIQFVSGDSLSQQSLLNNLKNLREGWPKAQVEVVLHGPGMGIAVTERTKHAKTLEDFCINKNIKMVVCENTMKQRNVTKAQLLPFIGTVPMGIGEIVLKQEKGWSYLKGGL